jgi:hypothetical protein
MIPDRTVAVTSDPASGSMPEARVRHRPRRGAIGLVASRLEMSVIGPKCPRMSLKSKERQCNAWSINQRQKRNITNPPLVALASMQQRVPMVEDRFLSLSVPVPGRSASVSGVDVYDVEAYYVRRSIHCEMRRTTTARRVDPRS